MVFSALVFLGWELDSFHQHRLLKEGTPPDCFWLCSWSHRCTDLCHTVSSQQVSFNLSRTHYCWVALGARAALIGKCNRIFELKSVFIFNVVLCSIPGSSLIKPLLDDFLFRASRIILNSHSPAGSAAISQQDFHPKYGKCTLCSVLVKSLNSQL